jgi:hypothetical protein
MLKLCHQIMHDYEALNDKLLATIGVPVRDLNTLI